MQGDSDEEMSDAQVPAQTAAAPDNSDAKDQFVTWFKTANERIVAKIAPRLEPLQALPADDMGHPPPFDGEIDDWSVWYKQVYFSTTGSRPEKNSTWWTRLNTFSDGAAGILRNCLSEVFKNDAGDRRPAIRRCVDTILLVMLALDLDEHIHGRWKKLLNNEDTWSVYKMRYDELDPGVLRVRVRAMAEELVLRRYRPTVHLDSDNQEQHSGVVAEGHGHPLLVNLPFHEEAAEVAALAAALVLEQAVLFPQPKHQWLEAMGMPTDDQGLHAQECRRVCSVVCQLDASDPSRMILDDVAMLKPADLDTLAVKCDGGKLDFDILVEFCKPLRFSMEPFFVAGHKTMSLAYVDRLNSHKQFLAHLAQAARMRSGRVASNQEERGMPRLYAPYVSIIQSSGMGKTRMMYHTAGDMHVVYCCLRRPEDIPHRSLIADILLARAVPDTDRQETGRSSTATTQNELAAATRSSSSSKSALPPGATANERADEAETERQDALDNIQSAYVERFQRYFAACLQQIVRQKVTPQQLLETTTEDNVTRAQDLKARSGRKFGHTIGKLMTDGQLGRVRQELLRILGMINKKETLDSIRRAVDDCHGRLPAGDYLPWPQARRILAIPNRATKNSITEAVQQCLMTMSPANMLVQSWTQYTEAFKQPSDPRPCRVLFVFDEIGNLATSPARYLPTGAASGVDLIQAMLYALVEFPAYSKETGTCLAVGMDTQSSTQYVALPAGIATSHRLVTNKAKLLTPFINVAFMDVLKFDTAADILADAAKQERIIRLGRPLFAGTYLKQKESPELAGASGTAPESWILEFAKQKLLREFPSTFYITADTRANESMARYQGARAIALLSVRACVTVRDHSELARDLVDSHMAVCYWISSDRDRFSTMHPSEPLLAEAAAQLLADSPDGEVSKVSKVSKWKDVLDALIQHQQSNDIDLGDNGELVARILLSRAWDRACCSATTQSTAFTYTRPILVSQFFKALLSDAAYNKFVSLWVHRSPQSSPVHQSSHTSYDLRPRSSDYKTLETEVIDDPYDLDYEPSASEGGAKGGGSAESGAKALDKNTASTPLQEHQGKLANAALMFTHFVAVANYTPDVKDLLWAFERGAAFICKPQQTGIDMVIPMVLDHDQRLGPANIGAILVQVKAAQTTANYPAVATSMMTVERAGMSYPSNTPYLALFMSLGHKKAIMETANYVQHMMKGQQRVRAPPSMWDGSHSQQISMALLSLSEEVYQEDKAILQTLSHILSSGAPTVPPLPDDRIALTGLLPGRLKLSQKELAAIEHDG